MTNEPAEQYPSGFGANVTLGVNGEPLVMITFLGEEGALSQIVLTEVEAQALVSVTQETIFRAALIREMTTMFPEQRQAILETMAFRWAGGTNGSDT